MPVHCHATPKALCLTSHSVTKLCKAVFVISRSAQLSGSAQQQPWAATAQAPSNHSEPRVWGPRSSSSCSCTCITNHFFSLTDTAASASAILLQQQPSWAVSTHPTQPTCCSKARLAQASRPLSCVWHRAMLRPPGFHQQPPGLSQPLHFCVLQAHHQPTCKSTCPAQALWPKALATQHSWCQI